MLIISSALIWLHFELQYTLNVLSVTRNKGYGGHYVIYFQRTNVLDSFLKTKNTAINEKNNSITIRRLVGRLYACGGANPSTIANHPKEKSVPVVVIKIYSGSSSIVTSAGNNATDLLAHEHKQKSLQKASNVPHPLKKTSLFIIGRLQR